MKNGKRFVQQKMRRVESINLFINRKENIQKLVK